ncbi:MAG: hypothetical protein ABJA34_00575 [Pseudonocardiales bacterium]
MRNRLLLVLTVTTLAILASPGTASASHSWNGYHWARTSNPFTLKVGDNVTPAWDTYLNTTVSDWSKSTVLDLTKVAGQAKGRCRGTTGRVEVCNNTYGQTGWLGVASISVSGKHITLGTVKLNDTYFNTSQYNTPAWRNLVSCQEVGHTLGLDHQDTNFDNPNLGTCMDYTNDPSTNQHPNQHDYDELVSIYSHLDSTTTVGLAPTAPASAVTDTPASWGRVLERSANGRASLFVRDLGHGNQVFTFVTWA